jgi:hypothetical protein
MTQLHSEQDAIKQAVEAGWNPANLNVRDALEEVVTHYFLAKELFFSTPAFWQALGKARGWKCAKCGGVGFTQEHQPTAFHGEECDNCPVQVQCDCNSWLYHALRYFEVKLSGGDLSDYWQSLP